MNANNSDNSSQNNSIDEIISGCIQGNKICQKLLFKKYKNKIYTIIVRYLGPYYDTDDIIQQVFINIFKSLQNFKGLSSFDTWIYRITIKICIDQLRKKYRKHTITTVNNQLFIDNYSTLSDASSFSLLNKELMDNIYGALDKLSYDKRVVIVLYEMEGFSIEQISKITNKPEGTIKSRLFHGRKELAKTLNKYINAKI